MIFVTGDTHGIYSRFDDPRLRRLGKGDTLIICGDFGFLWNGGREEKEVIKYLSTRKYTVVFLDGTHDNYDMIYKCRQTIWKGGLVHRIGDNLYHLCRGQIYTVEGISIFAFGGGESTDKDMRVEQGNWWRQENPTPNEMTQGAKTLDEAGRYVDYILTHEPPAPVKSAMLLRRGETEIITKINGYFDRISRLAKFRHWYFGSLHEDRMITPKHTCVFKELIPLKK